jgi:hypothetical protein
MTVIAALGAGNVGAWCHGVPSRGSNTITGVSVDRRPAYASRFGSAVGMRLCSQPIPHRRGTIGSPDRAAA